MMRPTAFRATITGPTAWHPRTSTAPSIAALKSASPSALPGGPKGAARRTDAGIFPSLAPCAARVRSEEHTSELQSLMRISYAVFCLKKIILVVLTIDQSHVRNTLLIPPTLSTLLLLPYLLYH